MTRIPAATIKRGIRCIWRDRLHPVWIECQPQEHIMRRTLALALAVCCVIGGAVGIQAAQAPSDTIAGQWTGTWDGAGSGNFELNLQKKDAGLAGTVAVTTD